MTSRRRSTNRESKAAPTFRSAIAAARIGHLWSADLQPYVFARVNTAGNTNYAAVGFGAKYPLGGRWYFRPGLGVAVHTGSAGKFYRTDKIAFGSRVLFEPEIGLGTQLDQQGQR